MKLNKDIEKERVCKAGLAVGRNDLKIEGNVQMGYISKTEKKYKPIDRVCGVHTEEEPEQEEQGLYTIKGENEEEELGKENE